MRIYELEIPVQDTDIDVLGHVNNIAYVRWVQDIAVMHSLTLGLDLDAYQRFGAFFVVRQHKIDYLRSITPGGVVQGRTWISSMAAAKCTRATEIWRNGEIVSRASTLWGFVDLTQGRPTRIPQEIYELFGVMGPGKLQPNGEWQATTYGEPL